MPRCRWRRSARGMVIAAGVLALGWAPPTASAAAPHAARNPVRLSARFDRDAVLGGATALDVDLRLDPVRLPSAQLVGVRFEYPASLGLISSGLGLAVCRRPASDFAQVLLSATGLAGCPVNSVMGYGMARAIIRLNSGQAIPEYATVTLLSGPIEHGHLDLVVFVDGQRPFGAKLAFAGQVLGAPPPFGGALSVTMPQIPRIQQLATVSLVELRVVIGSHAIRYRERRRGRVVTYRPSGIELPAACPRRGFPFRAQVTFADGTRRDARSTTACPSAVAPPGAGR